MTWTAYTRNKPKPRSFAESLAYFAAWYKRKRRVKWAIPVYDFALTISAMATATIRFAVDATVKGAMRYEAHTDQVS